MKKRILLAVSSGLLAGMVSLTWSAIFQSDKLTGENYGSVVSVEAIIISCLAGTILATLGHWLMIKILPNKIAEVLFGFLFSASTIVSLLGVFVFQFGDKCQECDQIAFWGYVMPMHFFPFLAWYTLKPLFESSQIINSSELENINPNDKPSDILNILSFLIPLVGLILYFTERERHPKKAKSVGIAAIWGSAISLILFIFSVLITIHDLIQLK